MLPPVNQTRAATASNEASSSSGLLNLNIAQGQIALNTLESNNLLNAVGKTLEEILQVFTDAERQRQADAFKQLEDRREEQRSSRFEETKAKKVDDPEEMGFADYLGIGAMIAGVSAIAGAFVGLRGWEVALVKQLNNVFKVSETIRIGSVKLRNALLRSIGFTPVGEMTRDVKGRFVAINQKPISTQIFDALGKLRDAILAPFRALASPGGLNLKAIPGVGLLITIKDTLTKVGTNIGTVLNPIFNTLGSVISGAKNFLAGPIFQVIGKIGQGAGGILRVFGNIFKPIGFVFSFADGVREFMKTEGNIFEKLNAGASKFLADFIGAPLDLLFIKLPAKVLKMIGLDSVAEVLEKFSFEETLFKIFKFPGEVISGFFTGVKKLFAGDGKGALEAVLKPFQGIINLLKSIVQGVINMIRKIPGMGGFLEDEQGKLEAEAKEAADERERVIQRQLEIAKIEEENIKKIQELKERIERSLAGENEFVGFESSGQQSAENRIAFLQNQIEQNKKLKIQNEQIIANLRNKEAELEKKIAETDFEGVSGQTGSGNGSADMLNALRNFSGDGFGGNGFIDNSNTDNSQYTSVNSEIYQAGGISTDPVAGGYKNYNS